MCVVLQHGGVTFLLMYTVMLGILDWPLLVLEAVLGQYSSLAPGHLYRHLCPLLAGLGLAVCLQASASKSSIRRFVITEKAPTRPFSWLKAATTAFTFKTLLRHYAKQALTPWSLNVKLGP